jgi:hypothetical protein
MTAAKFGDQAGADNFVTGKGFHRPLSNGNFPARITSIWFTDAR